MDIHILDAWIRIFRDVTIVIIGGFMLVYETVYVVNPNAYIIGGGLVALGLPPALRLDLRSSGRRSGDQKNDKTDGYDDLSGWGNG